MRCTGRQTGWRISSGKEVRHFWARDFARCGVRGTCAVRRGNKKGRHLRFLPSLNTRFPCGVAWVQMVDCVSVEKGNGRGFFFAAWYNTVSHFGCRTATQAVKLTQARHDSAAQRFYLCRLSKSCGCSQFAPEKRFARHCHTPEYPLLPFGQFTLCRALRRIAGMCSSKLSEMRM